MKKRQLRRIARGVAGSVALATVSPAWAGTVNIQMPQKGDAVGGANIACVAQFESDDRPITRVVFLVDGHELVPKVYQQPVTRARVTFVWDATGVPTGSHQLAVQAYSGDSVVGEDQVPVVISDDSHDIVRPQVHIYYPRPNSVVAGQQDIAIHAADNIGVAMISLFIDNELKLLQNVPPFHYSWDTTQYSNGPHTLEVWAYDAAQNKGESGPVRVFVNNATGRTEIKDLPDEVPATASGVKAAGTPHPTASAASSAPGARTHGRGPVASTHRKAAQPASRPHALPPAPASPRLRPSVSTHRHGPMASPNGKGSAPASAAALRPALPSAVTHPRPAPVAAPARSVPAAPPATRSTDDTLPSAASPQPGAATPGHPSPALSRGSKVRPVPDAVRIRSLPGPASRAVPVTAKAVPSAHPSPALTAIRPSTASPKPATTTAGTNTTPASTGDRVKAAPAVRRSVQTTGPATRPTGSSAPGPGSILFASRRGAKTAPRADSEAVAATPPLAAPAPTSRHAARTQVSMPAVTQTQGLTPRATAAAKTVRAAAPAGSSPVPGHPLKPVRVASARPSADAHAARLPAAAAVKVVTPPTVSRRPAVLPTPTASPAASPVTANPGAANPATVKPTTAKPTTAKPTTAKPTIAPVEPPVLMARLPVPALAEPAMTLRSSRPALDEAPMKPVLQHSPAAHARRAARTGPATGETAPRAETAPAVRAAAPAAARPAVTRPHALHRAGVAAVTAPVRMARAETGVQENLGRARADESAAVSPAAHHVLTARVPLRIMMGQDPIDFDVQPVIRDGIAIAPIRQIIEHSGGVVIWMPATRTVQATTGTRHIELKIGSRRAWINSELTLMERPAEIRSGRTLVPVRFLQVALDMKALYDPSKGMVYLYRP